MILEKMKNETDTTFNDNYAQAVKDLSLTT
jgi:hypothetical protein